VNASRRPTRTTLLNRLRARLPTLVARAEGRLEGLPLGTAFAVDLLRDEIARGAQAAADPQNPLPLADDDPFVQATEGVIEELMRRHGIPPDAPGAERRLILSLLIRWVPNFLPLLPREGLPPPSPYLPESRMLHVGGVRVFDRAIEDLRLAPAGRRAGRPRKPLARRKVLVESIDRVKARTQQAGKAATDLELAKWLIEVAREEGSGAMYRMFGIAPPPPGRVSHSFLERFVSVIQKTRQLRRSLAPAPTPSDVDSDRPSPEPARD
jgi:hypothetical protein